MSGQESEEEPDEEDRGTSEAGPEGEDGLEAAARRDQGTNPKGVTGISRFVQTMVFSATLTLPEKLRSRLGRGA
jgi:hypothetical protein